MYTSSYKVGNLSLNYSFNPADSAISACFCPVLSSSSGRTAISIIVRHENKWCDTVISHIYPWSVFKLLTAHYLFALIQTYAVQYDLQKMRESTLLKHLKWSRKCVHTLETSFLFLRFENWAYQTKIKFSTFPSCNEGIISYKGVFIKKQNCWNTTLSESWATCCLQLTCQTPHCVRTRYQKCVQAVPSISDVWIRWRALPCFVFLRTTMFPFCHDSRLPNEGIALLD